MKLIVFAILLAVLAAVSCSEYTAPETALSEDDSKPASSSSEDSDEDDSDEVKTAEANIYAAPVDSYVSAPEYKITYSVPTAAPAVYPAPAPVSSYDPPAILPYWMRPRY